nr:chromosomal replication initiator protein DnaA [Devriesea agamarum]
MTTDTSDPDETWTRCLTRLRQDDRISERAMAYLTFSRLMGFFGDTALIAVPAEYAKDLLEQRIPEVMREVLSQVRERETSFAVTIDKNLLEGGDDNDGMPHRGASAARSSEPQRPAVTPTPPPSPTVDNAVDDMPITARPIPSQHGVSAGDRTSAPVMPTVHSDIPVRPHLDRPRTDAMPATPPAEDGGSTLGSQSRLNSKYTFDTFVIGASNRFAQAAASAVAEMPAKAYNPLFIYGGSGLGKTHLLHAVGHYATSLFPGIEVRYVNSEEFTNDFINSVQSGQFGKAQEFHKRYRDIDILLIDDIQFLQRAPETMEAFFHTFNTLHNENKQIVITSDLPPKQLGGFEDRMRSRFEMGLMTDVQPPDLETRIAILRKKVEMEGNQEVPRDVLEYIASRISTNIRELEGALIRVQALHSLSRQPMDVSLAESVMKDLLANEDAGEVTATDILAQTAAYFGLSVEQLQGTARTRVLVTARQIAMYLCRELTDLPLIRIGQEFGGRDHTTVIHANKKISQLMKERRAIFNQVTELTARIKNGSGR